MHTHESTLEYELVYIVRALVAPVYSYYYELVL